jgi:hypothetical protein
MYPIKFLQSLLRYIGELRRDLVIRSSGCMIRLNLILVGDSRVYEFEKFDYRNFRFRYVIQRRAVVDNLVNNTLSIVGEYKDQNRSVIVKIACGINEFTVFRQRKEQKARLKERKEGKRSRETRVHRDLRFNDKLLVDKCLINH